MDGKLNWNGSEGGAMGGNDALKIGNDYVGHFYTDASEGVDADQVLADIAHRYNAHETLIAALVAARKELEEYEAFVTGETYNSPSLNAAILLATP